MEVKVLEKGKDSLEIELKDVDASLAQTIVERLQNESGVDFASFKKEHPIVSHPHIYLRTKRKDPKEVLIKVLQALHKDVAEFKSSFAEATG